MVDSLVKNQWRLWLGTGLSAVLLVALLRSVGLASLWKALAAANFWPLGLAVGVYFAGVWVRSLRWRILLRPIGEAPVSHLFQVMVVGFAANDLLPLRLGEVVRVYLLYRLRGTDVAGSFSTIVVERLLDGIVLTAFFLSAWLFVPVHGWMARAAMVSVLVFLTASVFLAGMAWRPRFWLRVGGRLLAPAPLGVSKAATSALEGFAQGLSVLRQGHALVAVGLLSVVGWCLEAGMYYTIMLGFGFPLGPQAAIVGTGAATLGTLIPSSPGFVGTFDVPLTAVMAGLFAVPAPQAAAFTLVAHGALVVPVVVLGLIYLWRFQLSLGDLASLRSREQLTGGS